MRMLSIFSLVCLAGCSHKQVGNDDLAPASDLGTNVPPTALAITPSTATATLHFPATSLSLAQFTATATNADSSKTDVSELASWTCSDPSVTIGSGVASATVPGTFTVTAAYEGLTANATLIVALTGSSTASGFAAGDTSKLDATPGAGSPSIAYPTANAIIPTNLAPLTVHVVKTDNSQTLARIHFAAGTSLSYDYYATCATTAATGGALPNAASSCYVDLPANLTALFASVSATDDIHVQARLAAPDGSLLVETPALVVNWANIPLSGGLYYWTTLVTPTTTTTAISRYDFDGNTSAPETVYTDTSSPYDWEYPQDTSRCIGCHAISRDGTKLALTIGGSEPSSFRLMDIGSMSEIALRNTEPPNYTPTTPSTGGFATMTTFSPDGTRMLNMYRGAFELRGTDAALMDYGPVLMGAADGESLTDPFWSADGAYLAFTSWQPGQNGALAANTAYGLDGDVKAGGQIWVASATGDSVGTTATNIVPRVTGSSAVTSYYPAISDDSALLVFNQSQCGQSASDNYANEGSCSGYNDPTASLLLTTPKGGTPVALANANSSGSLTNSWPRWSPDHGTWRGKTLYWVAFSSKRVYGTIVNYPFPSDVTAGKPQLWFAAVVIDPSNPLGADPSYPAVWLPGQDSSYAQPNGNHVPQWVVKAVTIQ